MNIETVRIKIKWIISLIKKYRLLVKSILIGGSNPVISFILYVSFIQLLGEEKYQLSLLASWCFSSFIAFTLQKMAVFKTKGNWLKEYKRFLQTWSIGYCINAVTLAIAMHWLSWHVIISQFLALFLTTATTFLLFKYFTFRH